MKLMCFNLAVTKQLHSSQLAITFLQCFWDSINSSTNNLTGDETATLKFTLSNCLIV